MILQFSPQNTIYQASPSHGSLAAKVFWKKAIKSYTGQPAEFESGIFYFSKRV